MTEAFYKGQKFGEWDETLKLGDLITTYHKGYFKLTKIEARRSNSPLFYYIQVYKEDGTPSQSKKQSCDATYCRRASEMLPKRIEELGETVQRLINIEREII